MSNANPYRSLGKEKKYFFECLTAFFSTTYKLPEIPTGLSEQKLLAIIARHRLLPQFYTLFKFNNDKVSDSLFNRLKQSNTKHAGRLLLLSKEIINISERFQSADLKVLFLKGPVLADRLGGKKFVRQSVDIDLFIQKQDLTRAETLLQKLGYNLLNADKKSGKNISAYSRKDILFRHQSLPVNIELHYRFFFNPLLNNQFLLSNPKRINVDFRGISVPTLDDTWHFIYLVAHGTLHQYFRLFWLYDVVLYLKSGKIKDWNTVQDLAKQTRLLVHFYLTLQLVKHIFQFELSDIKPIYKNEYQKSTKLFAAVVVSIYDPVSETIFKRLRRLFFFIRLDNHWKYRWHTLFGGLIRFME